MAEAAVGGEAAVGCEAAMHCVRCTDAWRDREQAGAQTATLCTPACNPLHAGLQPSARRPATLSARAPRPQPCASRAGGVDLLVRVWAERGRDGPLLRGALGEDVRVPRPRRVEPATRITCRGGLQTCAREPAAPRAEAAAPRPSATHAPRCHVPCVQVPRLQPLGAHRVLR